MFQNVHPDGNKSKPLGSRSVNYGRNSENVGLRDDRYVRCSKCGFMCHLDRDARAPRGSSAGDGNTYTTTEGWGSNNWGMSVWGDIGDVDPVTQAGCPFCGTYLYAS